MLIGELRQRPTDRQPVRTSTRPPTEEKMQRKAQKQAEREASSRAFSISKRVRNRVHSAQRRAGISDPSSSSALAAPLTDDDVIALISVAQSQPETCHTHVSTLRYFLKNEEVDVKPLLSAGVLSVLVRACMPTTRTVSKEDSKLRRDALWALSYLAAHSDTSALAVEQAASAILLEYARGSDEYVKVPAFYALANAASWHDETRCQLLVFLPYLAEILTLAELTVSVTEAASFFLCTLLHAAKIPIKEAVTAKVDRVVATHLSAASFVSPVHRADLLWCMAYLTSSSAPEVVSLLNAKLFQLLFDLISLPDDATSTIAAARIVGNAFGVNQVANQLVHSGPLLMALKSALSHPHRAVRKEAAWVLSCISSMGKQGSEKMVRFGFLPLLIELFKNSGMDIQREIAFILMDVCFDGGPSFAKEMTENGALVPFIHLLHTHEVGVVRTALEFVRMVLDNLPESVNLFEELDGIQALERVQDMDAPRLAGIASMLIDRHYGEDANGLQPESSSGRTAQ